MLCGSPTRRGGEERAASSLVGVTTFREEGLKNMLTKFGAALKEVFDKHEVTYGNIVRPISTKQLYFGGLTAHGYSQ